MENQQQKDQMLWQMAKRRAAFKVSFTAYLLVNVASVVIWYFTSSSGTYFWPVWPALGWGIGIAMQYVGAYHSHKLFSAEAEYERLRKLNPQN